MNTESVTTEGKLTTSTEDPSVIVEKTKKATHCVKRGERPCMASPVSVLILGSDMVVSIVPRYRVLVDVSRDCFLCVRLQYV
jgi:hypothetical protein